MTDETWRRDEPDSPCINICLIHPTARICAGCYRTPDEIAAWSRMSAPERARIRQELATRRPLITKRRGGRSRRGVE